MKLLLILIVGLYGDTAQLQTSFGSKIVNGNNAVDGQFPHQISIQFLGKHNCGGSILDETTILTAAHCLTSGQGQLATVLSGTINISEGNGDLHNVTSFIIHENYGNNGQNDIGILKIVPPIIFGTNAQAAKLPTVDVKVGESVTVSGWGLTKSTPSLPKDLQWIEGTIIAVEDCNLYESRPIDETQICIKSKTGQGACTGDSGGPLTDSDGVLVGIVSWGDSSCVAPPEVYTKVLAFLEWIENNRY